MNSETIFGNETSAYQTRPPDNIIDNPYTGSPRHTLQPGENVYGYVMGLTESSRPVLPLVVEGTDGSRHYNTVPTRRGGVWGRTRRTIVVHLDNSGEVAKLNGDDHALYIPQSPDSRRNALDEAYLGRDARYLDPAIAQP